MMLPDTETFSHAAAPPVSEPASPASSSKKKRSSGRTGPRTPLGRARSSQNAIKHGACAQTLLLACESEASWRHLLARWCKSYQIPETDDDSLEFDFIRRTAQAEWHRIRCQRTYDFYLSSLDGRASFNWTPDEVKMHDLHLRYKTAAERAFHRENRALQQHFRFIQQQAKLGAKAKAAIQIKTDDDHDSAEIPPFTVVAVDPESPTGYSVTCEIINGHESRERRPFTPPDPLPPDWPKFYPPPEKGESG